MVIITLIFFPSNTLRGNDSIWFCGQKGHHFLPQRQMPFSPDQTNIKYCSSRGGRAGRDEKTSTEENLPPTPFKQDGKMRLVPLPTSLLPGQQEGCPPLLLTVLLLPGFSCSWRFSVVTWGFFFSLMPGIICGSIYKSKVFVINPTQVPEGVMPGKWFGKVSRGQGPK